MTTLTDTQVITASGGLVELGYVERTTDMSVTTTAANVFSSNLTVVCDGSPVLVEFFVPRVDLAAATPYNHITGFVRVDGVNQTARLYERVSWNNSTATAELYVAQRLTPTAGTHTFNINTYVHTTGVASAFFSNVWGTTNPIWMRVSKIVQATQWPAVTTGTIICTSSTRPSAPFEGQEIYETDTDRKQQWTGTYWSQVWPQAFVTASDTTTQTGAPSSNFVYATATITITPGLWLVQGSASLINTVTADSAAVGLWNNSGGFEVANSRGPSGTTLTTLSPQLMSRLVQMNVSANTDIRVLCTRNGGSTIRAGSASGAPAAALWAQKVG